MRRVRLDTASIPPASPEVTSVAIVQTIAKKSVKYFAILIIVSLLPYWL
jgi:hypothetical protein